MKPKNSIFIILASMFLIFTISCAEKRPKPPETTTPASVTEKKGSKDFTTYYDFEDIPVPKEMKLITDKSFLVEYANLKGGIMHFEGRVKPLSLFNFFYVGLQKNGWNLVGYFKYGPYILLMEKPDKECVVRIEESGWNTNLEIWITPKGMEQE